MLDRRVKGVLLVDGARESLSSWEAANPSSPFFRSLLSSARLPASISSVTNHRVEISRIYERCKNCVSKRFPGISQSIIIVIFFFLCVFSGEYQGER